MNKFDEYEIADAKNDLIIRIDSLENDAKRAFYNILNIQASPFPILMSCWATVDYFSGFWQGWNIKTDKAQSQTDRIVNFVVRYLFYPTKETKIAVELYRHKLMHTSVPRLLIGTDGNKYGWRVANVTETHLKLVPYGNLPNILMLDFGIFNFVKDIRDGIFGAKGYFYDLLDNNTLRENYRKCKQKMDSYKIRL